MLVRKTFTWRLFKNNTVLKWIVFSVMLILSTLASEVKNANLSNIQFLIDLKIFLWFKMDHILHDANIF